MISLPCCLEFVFPFSVPYRLFIFLPYCMYEVLIKVGWVEKPSEGRPVVMTNPENAAAGARHVTPVILGVTLYPFFLVTPPYSGTPKLLPG
jgi:hypothetical protein